jgi:hypothetical protein
MESASNAATPGSDELNHSNIRVACPPRFDLSNSKSKVDFLNYLDEHGYAVVAAVADQAEVAAAKARFWSAAQLNPDDVLDPEAPECESRWWLNKHTGGRDPAICIYEPPFSDFVWRRHRQRPRFQSQRLLLENSAASPRQRRFLRSTQQRISPNIIQNSPPAFSRPCN